MQRWRSRSLVILVLALVAAPGAWFAMNRFSWAGKIDRSQAAPANASNSRLAQADDTDPRPNARPQLDVPYVPTAQEVVDEMLRLTNVKKTDMVYDLGCGDGRIVVTAAKRHGAKGIGVDIDPERIRESKANAQKAGVTKNVQFFVRDLFKMDVRPATVVTMYLLPTINLKLRPKLYQELRPGTRLVSHDFTMGNWQPDKTVMVKGPYREHTLYYWVMPANAAGTWSFTPPAGMGTGQGTLRLRQTFQELHGDLRIGNRSIPVMQGKMTGNRIVFNAADNRNGARTTMQFTGTVNGKALNGSVTATGANAGKRTFTARRTQAGQIQQPTDNEG